MIRAAAAFFLVGSVSAIGACKSSSTPRPQTSAPAVVAPAPTSSWAVCVESEEECPRVGEAFARCGTVPVSPRFVGRYELDVARSFPSLREDAGPELRGPEADEKKEAVEMFSNFFVESTRIHSGGPLVRDFCFVEVREQTDTVFDAVVIWHEDIGASGDANLSYVRLERDGSDLRFWLYHDDDERREPPLYLRAQ